MKLTNNKIHRRTQIAKGRKAKRMENKKLPKEQTTIRVAEDINNKIKAKAKEIGIPYNSMINVLLDMGLKLYDSNIKRETN